MNQISLSDPKKHHSYIYECEHRFFSDYSNELSRVMAESDWSAVLELSQLLLRAKQQKSRVFLCGNGGSAANAIHIANDLVYAINGSPTGGIDAIALTANPAVITCIANDSSYSKIYSDQVKVSGRSGDLLIALSGSGNSENILEAVTAANAIAMKTVTITGFDGGKAKTLASLGIHFDINDMQIAEDLQLIVGHMTMKWLKKKLR